MAKLRLSKKAIIIVLFVLVIIVGGATGFLIWRTNQKQTVAPTESEAGGGNGACCDIRVGCVSGYECVPESCTDTESAIKESCAGRDNCIPCGEGYRCRMLPGSTVTCVDEATHKCSVTTDGVCKPVQGGGGETENNCTAWFRDNYDKCEWPYTLVSGRSSGDQDVCRCEVCSSSINCNQEQTLAKGLCTPPQCPEGYEDCGTSVEHDNDPGCKKKKSLKPCEANAVSCNNPTAVYRYCRELKAPENQTPACNALEIDKKQSNGQWKSIGHGGVVNENDELSIQVLATDPDGAPRKVNIAYTIDGQSDDFYRQGEDVWVVIEDTNLEKVNSNGHTYYKAVYSGLKFSDMRAAILNRSGVKSRNLTSSDIDTKGIVFSTNVFDDSENTFCSTNPGYNNGKGIVWPGLTESCDGDTCLARINVAAPPPQNAPACKSMTVEGGRVVNGKINVDSNSDLQITVVAADPDGEPQKIAICYAVAGQTPSYYQRGEEVFECVDSTSLTRVSNGYQATFTGLTYDSMKNNLQSKGFSGDIDEYGIVISTNIFDDSENKFCSTNPGYRNGAGIMWPGLQDACDGDSCLSQIVLQANPSWSIQKDSSLSCVEGKDTYAEVTYTISVSNTSETDGVIDRVVDSFGSNFHSDWIIDGSITPSGTLSETGITWDTSSMTFAAGETKTFRYRARIPYSAFGTYINTATAYPKDSSEIKTSNQTYVTCSVPNTGLFDSTVGRIAVGVTMLILGGLYLLYDKNSTYSLRLTRQGLALISRDGRVSLTREKFEDRFRDKD